MRRLIPALLFLLIAIGGAASAQEKTERSNDTSLTQKWTSVFGYSFMLPEKAKFNKLGSETKEAEKTERINFILSGGNGSISMRYYTEKRMAPKPFYLLDDSIHYVQADSMGVNGRIVRRIYIMTDVAVQIEVLLTAKGEKEYADNLEAILDSFLPPPQQTAALEAWRYGRNSKEFEQGRYPAGGGPARGGK